jgi:hypothetical protein
MFAEHLLHILLATHATYCTRDTFRTITAYTSESLVRGEFLGDRDQTV